jgi:TOMM system kinase/cyclase fusion protein
MSDVAIQDEFAYLHFDSEDYDLQHKIGQGGFGSVFKAIHKKTKQTVAIKFLQFATQSAPKHRQQQLARFERESNFVCQLSHPHIVRLLDKGRIDDNTLYSVFEYVDGISLSDYLKQHGALSVAETHAIMLQVLDALVHAHQQGIIHRDIKPSNIMILQTGAKHHIKLLDFGISTLTLGQRAEDYKALTITQESIGTPTYCAPEQLRGELTTFSADLYMWGLVFIECLTGAPAINGASVAEIYHKHLNDIPVPIPAPLHSHPLGQLLQRSLRKNASERINSAQALYNELNELITHNLEGRFLPVTSPTQDHEDTLILRQDDPNHLAVNTTQTTERKQITTLALRIRIKNLGEDATDTDVIETLFQATRSQCVDVAQRYGGFHVGNLTGFSVFYFGYPVASDHDARLAARTALEIISLTKKQQSYMNARHGCEFELNIGIHTGILLKRGNTVPDGFASHHASDLALQAQGQSILCSLDTKTMLDNYYQFSEQQSSEHQSAPQDYTQLIAERAIEAFGFMRGVRNTYPLIGRATELDILRSSLENAAHHKIIHLHGEAGIGKSRLIHEFRQLESNRTHHIFQALPEHQNNALFPILSVIKRLLTSFFNQKQSQGKQLTQLIEQGNLLGPTAEIITLLAAWLNINDIENRQLSSLEPAVQKSLLFEGLAYILTRYQDQTAQHSKSAGNVYIFEDIHWADATSQEFIAYLSKQIDPSQQNSLNQQDSAQKLSIITTSRQPAPAAFNDSDCTSIHLAQLTHTATEEFINTLFDGARVANEVMTVLVTRTDGIPLFIEELVSMLKRRKLVQLTKGVIHFVDPQKIDEIPSSLRESIQNKIDALIYAKDTLQLAAVIGRGFSYNLLVTASHFSELQVQNDLAELIDNQLIIQQRHVDGDRYLFKHALVRDAGYDSIEKKTRPERHERIAESILTTAKNIDRFIASDLAQHYEKAQQYDNASDYYYQAASEAETTFAVDDAIHLYQSALQCYRKSNDLPEKKEPEKKEPDKKEYEKEQAQQERLKAILKGLANCLARDGQHENARQTLQEFIGLLKQANDYETLASAQIALGKTYEVVHQHDDALKHYQAAHVSLLKAPHSETPEKSDWWKIWLEIKSAILCVYYWQGNTDKMKPILLSVEPIAETIADKKQLIKYYYDQFQFQLRNKRYSLKSGDLIIPKKALKTAKQCNNQAILAPVLFMLGIGLVLSNKHLEAKKQLKSALELATTLQDKILQTRCSTYLSFTFRLIKDIQSTQKYAKQSLVLANETNMVDYIAVALANISWSNFAEGKYKQSSIYLEQSLTQWDCIKTRLEFPFLWLSHLQAIALCGVNDDFADKYIHQVPNFATILLDPKQVPLPQDIGQLLLQLSDAANISQRASLIEKLTKTAAEHRLL